MTEEAPPEPRHDRPLIVLLAAITAVGPVAMNIFLPALPDLQAEFGTSLAATNLTVSFALLAFAAGILVHGPLSDHYGRRPVILAGLAIFAVGNLLCLLAPSFGTLLAGRVVQALGTSAGVVVARAMLGDLYGRERMARMLAYLTMIMVVGPTLAPMAGGLLTEALGWRSIFVVLLVANLLIIAYVQRSLPETRHPGLRAGGAAALARDALALVRRRVFVGFALQASTIYAIFLAFISTAPYVMANLGHGPTAYGVWYLLVAFGYFLGNWLVTHRGARYGLARLVTVGVRIQLACIAAGAVLVASGVWHPAAIFVPMGLAGLGQGLAMPGISASAIALAPRTPGSAASILGFTHQMAGALAVQSLALLPAATPVPLYLFSVVVAAVTWLLLLAVPHTERATA